MAAAKGSGAGPSKPRPTAAKKPPAAEKADPAKPTPESIGIAGVIRVGGHVITDDGWTPEEDS